MSATAKIVEVELDRYECIRAWRAAQRRNRRAQRDGATGHNKQDPTKAGRDHFIGCLGELAVAKLLGVRWTSEFTHRHEDDDVAGYEVRTANGIDGGRRRCMVYDRDNDEAAFISAVVRHRPEPGAPHARVSIQGWITGRHARQVAVEEHHGGRRGLYVPNASLCDIQQVIDVVREQHGL